jgi:hypothetical protein
VQRLLPSNYINLRLPNWRWGQPSLQEACVGATYSISLFFQNCNFAETAQPSPQHSSMRWFFLNLSLAYLGISPSAIGVTLTAYWLMGRSVIALHWITKSAQRSPCERPRLKIQISADWVRSAACQRKAEYFRKHEQAAALYLLLLSVLALVAWLDSTIPKHLSCWAIPCMCKPRSLLQGSERLKWKNRLIWWLRSRPWFKDPYNKIGMILISATRDINPDRSRKSASVVHCAFIRLLYFSQTKLSEKSHTKTYSPVLLLAV